MGTGLPTFAKDDASKAAPFYGLVHYPKDWTSLTVRDGPGSDNHIAIYDLNYNAEVLVISKHACDNNASSTTPWYFIQHKTDDGTYIYGYVSSNPIDYEKQANYPFPFTGSVVTESSNLNMRAEPDAAATKLASIPKGTTLKIETVVPAKKSQKQNPFWYKTQYAGKTGYVAAQYVKEEITPTPTPPPKPTPKPTNGKPTPQVTPKYTLDHTAPMPLAYQPYLEGLQAMHPNWKFVFYDSGLDWNDVVKAQTEPWQKNGAWYSKSLLASKFPISYRLQSLKYTPIEGKTWFAASAQTVSYYLDPRNSMTEARIFQFESNAYQPEIHTLAGVEKMLQGTALAGKTILTNDGKKVTYAQTILEAAKQSGASPYFLLSRILMETGNGTSGSVTGTYPGHEGYYNFYNFGANTKGDTVANALAWAAATDADTIKNAGRPWATPYHAIIEGAKKLSREYVAKGQDTLYYQKFDLVPPSPYRHQFMTNISAPYTESPSLRNAYRNLGLLDTAFVFKIPTYRKIGRAHG